MITVTEALNIILNHTRDFGIDSVNPLSSMGRILREEITADRDMPPFDRVAMDGIAINYDDFAKGIRSFTITGMVPAGDTQKELSGAGNCLEIMTGAIMPSNADTIIPYEWIHVDQSTATIHKDEAIRGQNVHLKGTDRKKNDLLIHPGKQIDSPEIAILTSVGKKSVKVSRLPRVLLVATGYELVDLDQEPLPHQIRMSNIYQLQSALQSLCITSERLHLNDDFDSIKKALSPQIESFDAIIISGGISAGKLDYIPAALEAIGFQKHFYKVKQKPGKPFWFGTHQSGCTVFALPGNPVSSFLCYVRFIHPWLISCMQGVSLQQMHAKLNESIFIKAELTTYIPVHLINENATLTAIPMKGHGSGDLANLTDADGFIELAGKGNYPEGTVVPLFIFRK